MLGLLYEQKGDIRQAITILDEFSIPELIDIMIREDFKELSRAKGVGAKVAQKIILELNFTQ